MSLAIQRSKQALAASGLLLAAVFIYNRAVALWHRRRVRGPGRRVNVPLSSHQMQPVYYYWSLPLNFISANSSTDKQQRRPTVIFVGGATWGCAAWFYMQRQLAQQGIASFSYDKPGYALSAPLCASTDRTAETMAAELHDILNFVGVPEPYILVGHELGGLVVRVFAAKYPVHLKALVLADSTCEELWPSASKKLARLSNTYQMQGYYCLSGLARASEYLNQLSQQFKLFFIPQSPMSITGSPLPSEYSSIGLLESSYVSFESTQENLWLEDDMQFLLQGLLESSTWLTAAQELSSLRKSAMQTIESQPYAPPTTAVHVVTTTAEVEADDLSSSQKDARQLFDRCNLDGKGEFLEDTVTDRAHVPWSEVLLSLLTSIITI